MSPSQTGHIWPSQVTALITLIFYCCALFFFFRAPTKKLHLFRSSYTCSCSIFITTWLVLQEQAQCLYLTHGTHCIAHGLNSVNMAIEGHWRALTGRAYHICMSEPEPRRMERNEALNKQDEARDIRSFIEAIVRLALPKPLAHKGRLSCFFFFCPKQIKGEGQCPARKIRCPL